MSLPSYLILVAHILNASIVVASLLVNLVIVVIEVIVLVDVRVRGQEQRLVPRPMAASFLQGCQHIVNF